MDKRKVLSAPVPYIELFSVDGMGKGRPENGSAASELIPKLELPAVDDYERAKSLQGKANTRALTVLKTLHARDFKKIYRKELDHLVGKQSADLSVAEGAVSVAVTEGGVSVGD